MMKRYLLFFGAIVLFSAILFTSACTTDNNTTSLPPTIEFVAGSGYITADATVAVDAAFIIKVLAQ